MKAFGYAKGETRLLTLSEVSMAVTADELRGLAAFFLECADDMERMADYDHRHYADFRPHADIETDVIVASARYIKVD